jgi:hypothetical protein
LNCSIRVDREFGVLSFEFPVQTDTGSNTITRAGLLAEGIELETLNSKPGTEHRAFYRATTFGTFTGLHNST